VVVVVVLVNVVFAYPVLRLSYPNSQNSDPEVFLFLITDIGSGFRLFSERASGSRLCLSTYRSKFV
jgi:hypothetical protein